MTIHHTKQHAVTCDANNGMPFLEQKGLEALMELMSPTSFWQITMIYKYEDDEQEHFASFNLQFTIILKASSG